MCWLVTPVGDLAYLASNWNVQPLVFGLIIHALNPSTKRNAANPTPSQNCKLRSVTEPSRPGSI